MSESRRTSALSTLFLSTVICFGSLVASPASFASPAIEVAESVPVETNLAVPGIRSTQEVWLEMINSAQSSIDLEQFYVSNRPNEALDPVLAALRSAAARGVRIRFVIDSKFYSVYPDDVNALNQVPGIQVKTIDFSSLGGIQHSKYFIVDRSKAFVGSANFDWLALTHIHEVGLEVSDAQIGADLESIFEHDWAAGSAIAGAAAPVSLNFLTSPDFPAALSSVQVFASPAVRNPSGIPDTLTALTTLIDSAQSSIKIQVYEYATTIYHSSTHWRVLDDSLRRAAARGIQVQLLVDAKTLSSGRADLNALKKLNHVEIHVVRIPQWSGGPLKYARVAHSKYMIVDGATAWVGSENWSGSYFTGARNVGLIVRDPDVADSLNRIYSQVWNSPYASLL